MVPCDRGRFASWSCRSDGWLAGADGSSVASGSDRADRRIAGSDRTGRPAGARPGPIRTGRRSSSVPRPPPQLAWARRGRLIRGCRQLIGFAATSYGRRGWQTRDRCPGIDDRTRLRQIANGFDAGGFDAGVACPSSGGARVRHRPSHHPIRPPARARPLRAGAVRRAAAPEFTPR